MSYTPRTDAAEFHVDDDCSVQDGMVVSSEVSRKLEIELAEAIRAANYWKAEASRECTLAQRANKERDELRAEVERLKAELEQAEAMVGCYKADKARLDWLEDNHDDCYIVTDYDGSVRDAIDAAMKGPQP